MSRNFFNLFATTDLMPFLERYFADLEGHIEKEGEDVILNENLEEYTTKIKTRFCFPLVELGLDEIFRDDYENVPSNTGFIPIDDEGRPSEKDKEVRVVCKIPYCGTKSLLFNYVDDSVLAEEPIEFYFDNNFICFEVVLDTEEPKKTDNEIKKTIERIRKRRSNLERALNEHNEKLLDFARDVFTRRKAFLIRKKRALAELDIPLEKREDTPRTFSIPRPELRKKIELRKPETTTDFEIEPALDEITYRDVLKIIYDAGKELEKLPSIYMGKKEPDLRDLILFVLQPHYVGSATAETFNKKGKTDILLKYENTNVFVGECKFWKGEKALRKAVNQLLGNLSWRDSKSALIIFVDRFEIIRILENVESYLEKHPNYLRTVSRITDSWFDFRFFLKDARDREVYLAVLVFHLPRAKKPKAFS